jgi:hypothetical protein
VCYCNRVVIRDHVKLHPKCKEWIIN